jgi:O-antigen/teichoic acid export membrane protein
LSSLSVNVPRYFIESYVGQKELGVFAGFVGLFGAVYFVQVAIGQAALPRLAHYHASGMGKRYLRLSTLVLGIALAGGMAGVVLAFVGGAGLLRIVYSEEFAEHADLFRWLSIASVGQAFAAALSYFLSTARRFHQIASVGLVATLATSVCCAWLIPRWGLAGAAWAVLAGPLVSCALYGVLFVLLLKSMAEKPYLTGSPPVPEHAVGA